MSIFASLICLFLARLPGFLSGFVSDFKIIFFYITFIASCPVFGKVFVGLPFRLFLSFSPFIPHIYAIFFYDSENKKSDEESMLI